MHNVSEMWLWYAFELNQKHAVIYCTVQKSELCWYTVAMIYTSLKVQAA